MNPNGPFRIRKGGMKLDTRGGITVNMKQTHPVDLGQHRFAMAFLEVTRTDRDTASLISRFGTPDGGSASTLSAFEEMRHEIANLCAAMRGAGLFANASPDAFAVTPPASDHDLADILNAAITRHRLNPLFVKDGGALRQEWQSDGTLAAVLVAQAVTFAQAAKTPTIALCSHVPCDTIYVKQRSDARFCGPSCRTLGNRD